MNLRAQISQARKDYLTSQESDLAVLKKRITEELLKATTQGERTHRLHLSKYRNNLATDIENWLRSEHVAFKKNMGDCQREGHWHYLDIELAQPPTTDDYWKDR